MHIAINGWFWDQPHTGSGQYLHKLLTSLRRITPELRLTLVLPRHIREPGALPADVAVVHADAPRGNLGKIWFEQRAYPSAVARVGADIAHVPYWGPPLAVQARLVVSVLDVIPLVIPDYAASTGARLYTSLVTAATRGAAHVITLSNASKKDIVDHIGYPPKNITVTYLASDETYHPRLGAEIDAQVKAKYDLPDNFVLYLSGFDIRKQLNRLLLAYTYVGPSQGEAAPLVIGGREPAWGSRMFPDMRQYAHDLNIEDYVRWIGYVDEADKPSLYRLASVFVYPSIYEGFGLPPLEAMASGTPVVACDIPVVREVVGDAAYLVEQDNERQMGAAILSLLLQQPLQEQLVQRGLSQATRFSYRKTARETLSVYERVMRETAV
ncbi:MAG: glycosyltransferase family 4 protein [Anaerolineae bacterium]|nr:glycosyltransferase family 4 protein [Anaerolineae bacterium]